MNFTSISATIAIAMALATPVNAQDAGAANADTLSGAYTGKAY